MFLLLVIALVLLSGGGLALADASSPSSSTDSSSVDDSSGVTVNDVTTFNPDQLSPSQIASYASDAGFEGNDLVIAVAVALAESDGKPGAVGDKTLAPSNGPSIGLWQINIGTRAHPQYASHNLKDPATNAADAFTIYSDAGNTFNPWATYNPRNGTRPKYLARMSAAQAGVNA